MRFAQVALSCVVVASLAVNPGCKSTGAGGAKSGHPTHLYVDPGFTAPESMRLPMIGFENTSTEAQAPQYFFQFMEDALRDKPQYQVLSTWAVERDVRRQKLGDQFAELKDQWRSDRQFDPIVLKEFGDAMGVSHVMGGEVSEWRSEEIDINIEGYSHSNVAASFKIFAVDTGELVWEAVDRFEMKSQHYDPSAGADRQDDLGIVRGEARVVPPAPPIEEAAKVVATNLVASLP